MYGYGRFALDGLAAGDGGSAERQYENGQGSRCQGLQ